MSATRIVLITMVLCTLYTVFGCQMPKRSPSRSATKEVYDLQLTETRGARDRHFSTRIVFTGGYITRPVFGVVGRLPQGLELVGELFSGVGKADGQMYRYSYTGIIEGTPRESGIFNLTIAVRDRDRGLPEEPTPYDMHTTNRFRREHVTIRIYDEYADPK